MKIKEVIAECTKEKLKAQKTNEKLIEETKRKQWVFFKFILSISIFNLYF